ncbi:MAG: ABC transporter ATP-binding protein [Oligoflexia bacterium]|nr:ABC transporter ATP-binding protein [Oligoflexia bacterium]
MLKLIDVTAGYGKNFAIKNTQFELGAGEIHGLIGINGAGKSTLLKAILGTVPVFGGKIEFQNQPLHQQSHFERARCVGLHDSSQEFIFSSSVHELLELSLRLHHDSQKLKTVVKLFGLEDLLGRDVLSLSSGERQRALLAHAFCANPRLLMLDEPFTHLDWHRQLDLIEVIKEWRHLTGCSFLIALHELQWAINLADRLSVIDQGKILVSGPPDKVLPNPQVGETFAFQALIDENPIDGSRRLTLGRRQ